MVALDIVHASNARLRELGPGLVALFGMTALKAISVSTNSKKLVVPVALENSLSKLSSRIQPRRVYIWWGEMPQLQTES